MGVTDIINAKGNTFFIDTGMTYVPFYKIDDDKVIMLDAGWAKGEREGIEEALLKEGLRIKGIICSHFHMDHVSNCGYFKEKYGCIIAMPAYEALICSSSSNLKMYYNMQTLTEVETYYRDSVFETDIMVSDRDECISMSNVKFHVLHLPGHSPAQIGIITPDDVAYIGDSLISYDVMKGAKMPYAYILSLDLKTKNSLKKLHNSMYIIAHKGVYDNINELIEDNIMFYKDRARGVYSVIKGSMTIEDILKAAVEKFNIPIKNSYKYNFMQRMVRSYVEYLNEAGVIKLELKDGYLMYSRTDPNITGEKIMEINL